jgi:hypothetical protein
MGVASMQEPIITTRWEKPGQPLFQNYSRSFRPLSGLPRYRLGIVRTIEKVRGKEEISDG